MNDITRQAIWMEAGADTRPIELLPDWKNKLVYAFCRINEMGFRGRNERKHRLAFLSDALGRPITSMYGVTLGEFRAVVKAWENDPRIVDDYITRMHKEKDALEHA